MGNGSWSSATYDSTTARKVSSGTSFAYSSHVASSVPRSSWTAHEDLDPKKVAGPASPLAGQTNLFGLLLRKGYVEHPQIMMGAYGDHQTDRVPLQVSQFESDNRIDDALDNLFLEGYGGGNGGESQWLAWYYLAAHTATDAWEKRDKKGYAFFIGDEVSITPDPHAVQKFIGDGEPLVDVSSSESLVKALLEKWDAYVFVINNMTAHGQKSIEFYTKLFGTDRVLVVENEEAIAETIALVVGTNEGVIDIDDGVDDLKSLGVSDDTIRQATKAVSVRKNDNGSITVGAAPADLDGDDDVARL